MGWFRRSGRSWLDCACGALLHHIDPLAFTDEILAAHDDPRAWRDAGNPDRGILVSRFWYIRGTDARTASSTGLTRDGVWLIENGKISHPVKNFRFNQSVTQMLAPGNVEMIGVSERVGGSEGGGSNSSLLPALKLKVFNFTSQSEAV